jgi:uncharacterized protein (DUF58 family)
MPHAAATAGVYVDLDHLVSFEAKGRKLSLSPRQPVNSLLSGRFASRLRGRGLNFEEIRDYRAGDDVRSIDWKVTARLRKPHVRVFNEERDRQGLIIVDQRLFMFFGSRRAMKSVAAAEIAALMAWRILAAGDRVGGIVFDDRESVEIRPRRSRGTVLRFLQVLAEKNAALGIGRSITNRPAMLNLALERARQLAAHDTTIIVLSDFDGADAATRQAIAAMTIHNDVVAVVVHDPLQSELPPSGEMTVTDGELQIMLDAGNARMRRNVFEMSQERLRDVFAWTRDLGVPVLPLSAAEDGLDQVHRLLGQLPPRGRSASRRNGSPVHA